MSPFASAPRRRRISPCRQVPPSGSKGSSGYCLHPPSGSKAQPLSTGAGAVPQRPFGSALQPDSAQSADRTPRSQPPKFQGMGIAAAGAAAESRAINRAARGRTDRRERIVDIENLPFQGAVYAGRDGGRLRPGGVWSGQEWKSPSERLVSGRFHLPRGANETA